jgi:hypothetical protein
MISTSIWRLHKEVINAKILVAPAHRPVGVHCGGVQQVPASTAAGPIVVPPHRHDQGHHGFDGRSLGRYVVGIGGHVRRAAIRLIEGPNLLVMDGRHVAKPGEKSENPGIELEPQQMEDLINKDRESFIKLAHALQDAGGQALSAIDKKNAEGLLDAGEAIDTACENCHLKYWYPLDQQAQKAKEGAGSVKKS